MLVLSRHKNEQIVIAENIVITIVEIRGDKVRVGIEAPREISVHRREVFNAIEAEARRKAEAAALAEADGSSDPLKDHVAKQHLSDEPPAEEPAPDA